MKIAKRVLLLVIVSLMLVGCSGRDKKNIDDISIENFPSVQELSEMSKDEQEELKRHSKTFPLQDCEEYFFEIIDTFLRSEDGVELESLKITEDSELDEENNNPLRNLTFEIDLKFDTDQILEPDSLKAQQNIAETLIGTLTENSYFALNVRYANVYDVSQNGKIELLGYSGGDVPLVEDIK